MLIEHAKWEGQPKSVEFPETFCGDSFEICDEAFKINHRILRTNFWSKPKAGSPMPGQPVKILGKPYSTFIDLLELSLPAYKNKEIGILSWKHYSINTNYQFGTCMCMCTWTMVCTYVCVYIHVYVYMYVCIGKDIWIETWPNLDKFCSYFMWKWED